MTTTHSPAYAYVGTTMHAAPSGPANTTAQSLCGSSLVVRARGDFTAAALARSPMSNPCHGCLSTVIATIT